MINARAVNGNSIRLYVRAELLKWVEGKADLLTGRVLDFGAGKPGTCFKPEPYRHLVKGEYNPIDVGDVPPMPGTEGFDTILCTQVLVYLPAPRSTLQTFKSLLRPGGRLVMTYPCNWDVVESIDLSRFTKHGMKRLLEDDLGMTIEANDEIGAVEFPNFRFPLNYGVVARKDL